MFVNVMFQGMVAHPHFNNAYIFLRNAIEASAEISEQLLLANEMLPAYLVIGRYRSSYIVPIVGILC